MKDDHAIPENQPKLGEPVQRPGASGTSTLVIVLTVGTGDAEREPQWQWRVRSVETGVEGRFLRVEDVLAFVAAISGQRAPL